MFLTNKTPSPEIQQLMKKYKKSIDITTVSPTTVKSDVYDENKDIWLQIPQQVLQSQLMLQIPEREIKKQMPQIIRPMQQLFQELKIKAKKQMNPKR